MKKSANKPFYIGVTEDERQFNDRLSKSTVEVVGQQSLEKSILNLLNGPEGSIERLAFTVDPTNQYTYGGVYKPITRLVPNVVKKRIATQDSLVSNIVRARQNHMFTFGKPRPDRYSLGFIIEPFPGVIDKMSDEQKETFSKRCDKAIHKLNTCGDTEGRKAKDIKSFAEWLSLSVRDAEVVGYVTTEIVYKTEIASNEKQFHYFAHVDAGTIYQATEDSDQAQQAVREEAFDLLERVTGKEDLIKEKFKGNDYDWVQVIDGTPRQVFTDQELKVANFYPAGNIELEGYPVTPIDTVISAITTHLSITTHNRLYFQSGRAARGMIVIQSDDVSPAVVHNIKQSFMANINSVDKAWRLPVFSVPTDSEITWQPIDTTGSRDMEFQYLTDLNAREILTAFMMSPDELPGWSYLSRGTNSQALSESKGEFQLEAGRDVGIRPLIQMFESFINKDIFPLIDADLAKIARVTFAGLDADSPEKEIVSIQQRSQVEFTFNDIMKVVEKPLIPRRWCSEIPLNPVYKSYLDQYCTVGQIMEYFMGVEGASKDPRWDYVRDPLYFQNEQLRLSKQQLQQQAQAAQQQPQQDDSSGQPNDLESGVNQASEMMKSEANIKIPTNKRKLLQQQERAMKWLNDGLKEDSDQAIKVILEEVKKVAPK